MSRRSEILLGALYVQLSGAVLAFADSLGIAYWTISITRRGDISTASVIAMGD